MEQVVIDAKDGDIVRIVKHGTIYFTISNIFF